jgi:hypothetical protein
MCEVKESFGYLSTRSGTRYILATNCSTDFENDSSDTKVEELKKMLHGEQVAKEYKRTWPCEVVDEVTDRLDQSDRWVKWKSKDNHNFGKDEYVVDMTGHETQHWQGTESGLLGSFEFQGTYTGGDNSCDTDTRCKGTGFCNLNHLDWNTQTPLPPPLLQEQRPLHSRKVGQEDEDVSSIRPELVDLTERLEDHEDKISPLYLTDNEAILQAIHRLIDYEVKLNLSKSSDTDVFKKIILKLQKRVQEGVVTSLVKVKDHRQGTHPMQRTSRMRDSLRPEVLESLTNEGLSLLDDMELWWEKQNLLWVCHN